MKVVKYFLFAFILIANSSVYAQKSADTSSTPFSAPKQLGNNTAKASDTISAFSAPKPLGVHDKVTGDTVTAFAAPKPVKTEDNKQAAAKPAFTKPRSLENHVIAEGAKKPAPPNTVLQWEPVSGDAASDIYIVTNAKGSCNNNLTPINIINTSATKAIIATVEITTKYGGHVSKKMTTVDNISPNESRQVGCMGCMESAFKSCFTYRVVTANYK